MERMEAWQPWTTCCSICLSGDPFLSLVCHAMLFSQSSQLRVFMQSGKYKLICLVGYNKQEYTYHMFCITVLCSICITAHASPLSLSLFRCSFPAATLRSLPSARPLGFISPSRLLRFISPSRLLRSLFFLLPFPPAWPACSAAAQAGLQSETKTKSG